MSEYELLKMIGKDLNKMEILKLEGFDVNDFESKDDKLIFTALKNASEMKLTEPAYENFVDVELGDFTAKSFLSAARETEVMDSSFMYHLSKLRSKKRERKERILFEKYNMEIENESSLDAKEELRLEREKKLMDLNMSFVENRKKTIAELAPLIYNKEALKLKPVPTGIPFIDAMTGGMRRGVPSVFSGESGNGKSLILRNIAVRQALDNKYGGLGLKVLVVSLELSAELMAQQFLAILDDVEVKNWYNYNLNEETVDEKLTEAERLAKAVPNLYIDDSAYTPEQLAKLIKQSHDFDVIWVDYFQAISIPEGQSEGQAYNRASKLITKAIKEVKTTALGLLSQITTANGGRASTEKEHKSAKIRNSKQLLNDAAFECRVFQDEEKEETEEDAPDFNNEEQMINLYIQKNRFGKQEETERIPYFAEKGIVGTWSKIEVEETEEEYKNSKRWEDGTKPAFDYDNIPIFHLNRPELRYLGYNIPEHIHNEWDKEGIRKEILEDYLSKKRPKPIGNETIEQNETNDTKNEGTNEFEELFNSLDL